MRLSRLVSLIASVVLLATAQSFGVATVKFANVVRYAPGASGSNSMVAADVNSDGFPDMIVATNNGVSVVLNNDDGTYAPAVSYPTGGTLSTALAVVDVNNDSILDIVVTNSCLDPTTCSGVAVLLGNGDGTFQAAAGYDSGGLETGAVAVGDFNGDGFPDLVLTSNCQPHTCAGGTLTVMLNNGDGTFGKAIELSDIKGGPVAVGDFNGDGFLDLVTGAGLLLGNGDGTFGLPVADVPAGAVAIAAVDMNGDGKLDVVTVVTTQVAVQLGNGDGTFQPANLYRTGGISPLAVTVADFNGDNKLDLAVANECGTLVGGKCLLGSMVGVLAGNGDGTFKPFVAFFTGGSLATAVAAADADQDGRTDILVANACIAFNDCSNGQLGVLLNIFVAGTSTKVVSSQPTTGLGVPVMFTATVTSSTSSIPDGSTVTFSDAGTTIGTATTVKGSASVTVSFTTPGRHVIMASYAGDVYHAPSSNAVGETVNKYASTTMVTSNPSSSTVKQSVTFTATVTSAEAGGPTGTVTFSGASGLGTVTLSGGVATLTTTKLSAGTFTITAKYNGDTLTATSTASTVQTVNP